MNRHLRKFAYSYIRLLRLFGTPQWKLPVVLPDGVDYYHQNQELQRLFTTIADYTLVDKNRVMMLWQFARSTRNLPGDVAEIGVYKGGTARLLAEIFKSVDKKVYLFDTFGGMPETSPDKDWHKPGDFSDTTLESTRKLLQGLDSAEIRPGFFPVTARGLENHSFCFVHVDADIYQSVWDSCEFFYPRLSPGGMMVFDDYGFATCPGAKEAVDSFFSGKPECPFLLTTYQALLVKR